MLMYLAAAAPKPENPYGLMEALEQGGTIAWTVFIILCRSALSTFCSPS
jgi:biopolymer transport protein ExbB